MINTLTLRTRIGLLILAAFIGITLTDAIAAFQVKRELMEAHKLQISATIQSAVQLVAGFHDQVAKGEFAEDEGKRRALQVLSTMRYGGEDGKTEYLYVWSTGGASVMHPFRPEWRGKNMTEEIRDGQGRYTIKDILAVARSSGGGFVDTSFPRPGQTEAVDKLQYVMVFQPWDWIIGTGVYVDNVEAAFNKRMMRDLGIAALIMVFIVGFGFLIARSILRQIGGEPAEAVRLMSRAAGGI